MKIVRYLAVDLTNMASWLLDRGERPWDLNAVPAIGFVAVEGIDAVAIGFLRQVEGDTAMIDGIVTNPKARAHTRHRALNMLVTQLILTAKAKGFVGLTAFTSDPNTLERSAFFGFKAHPCHTFISLSLKDK